MLDKRIIELLLISQRWNEFEPWLTALCSFCGLFGTSTVQLVGLSALAEDTEDVQTFSYRAGRKPHNVVLKQF
jgi:hypothetical protein